MEFWTTLGINPTKNTTEIKQAYAQKSKSCHPEENPQGFAILKSAYQDALAYANDEGESSSLEEILAKLSFTQNKDLEPNFILPEDLDLNFAPPDASTFDSSSVDKAFADMQKLSKLSSSGTSTGTLFDMEPISRFPCIDHIIQIFTENDDPSFEDLMPWVFSDDFLSNYKTEEFFNQLRSAFWDLSPEEHILPVVAERVLCSVYGVYWEIEDEKNIDDTAMIAFMDGMEFDGIRGLFSLLRFFSVSYSHSVIRGKEKERVLTPDLDFFVKKTFLHYTSFTKLVDHYEDTFLGNAQMSSIFEKEHLFFSDLKDPKAFTDPSARYVYTLSLYRHYVENHPCHNNILGFLSTFLSLCCSNCTELYNQLHHELLETLRPLCDLSAFHTQRTGIYSAISLLEKTMSATDIKQKYVKNFITDPHMVPIPLFNYFDMNALSPSKQQALDHFHENLDYMRHPHTVQHFMLYILKDHVVPPSPVFLSSLLDLYKDLNNPFFTEVKFQLQLILARAKLIPYLFLNKATALECTTLPDAFTQEEFWIYFFSLAFPEVQLDRFSTVEERPQRDVKIHSFLKLMNVPWMLAFTGFSPYEMRNTSSPTMDLEVKGQTLRITFEESIIWYSIDGVITTHLLNFSELLDYAKDDAVLFFLLLPLTHEYDHHTMEIKLHYYFKKLPIPSFLHRDLTAFMLQHLFYDYEHSSVLRLLQEKKFIFHNSTPSLAYMTEKVNLKQVDLEEYGKIFFRLLSETTNPVDKSRLEAMEPYPTLYNFYETYVSDVEIEKKILLGYHSTKVTPPYCSASISMEIYGVEDNVSPIPFPKTESFVSTTDGEETKEEWYVLGRLMFLDVEVFEIGLSCDFNSWIFYDKKNEEFNSKYHVLEPWAFFMKRNTINQLYLKKLKYFYLTQTPLSKKYKSFHGIVPQEEGDDDLTNLNVMGRSAPYDIHNDHQVFDKTQQDGNGNFRAL